MNFFEISKMILKNLKTNLTFLQVKYFVWFLSQWSIEIEVFMWTCQVIIKLLSIKYKDHPCLIWRSFVFRLTQNFRRFHWQASNCRAFTFCRNFAGEIRPFKLTLHSQDGTAQLSFASWYNFFPTSYCVSFVLTFFMFFFRWVSLELSLFVLFPLRS